ncbi:MAG: type II toxin-antitoxin system RelE/ParE family toxin [Desulfobulbaceae bacterium]|jgi:toxin ParE1/3/4|nr:type II toxin-antitoxin system RelE/ParE family toxin [Desulfobulbaceae bacterium]
MYDVFVVTDAEEDIFEIYQYVATKDSPGNAAKLFDNIQETITSLDNQPMRGHIPPELSRIDVREFLEIHYKPYRIIYQIIETDVFVHCVVDGRRDLSNLLQRRLLRN